MKKLLTNSKSNFVRNLGLVLLLITPIVMATSCKKEPIPCNDYTNPECPNYDPCYGVVDTYNSKKANEQNAASNVRSTFQAIRETSFVNGWDGVFDSKMNEYVQNTGVTNLNIKDTAIVAKTSGEFCIENYGSIPGFMDDIGPSIYNNMNADSTYIVTQEDMMNYYLQNQSCIDN